MLPRMVVTVRDVAKRANVSQATAARALGGYGHVSAAAKRAVLRAAAELQYRPNGVARSLVSGSTNTIGLIVGDIENPFFATVARALADAVEETGYTLLLANSDEDLEREQRAADALLGRLVDAIAVAPAIDTDGAHLRQVTAAGRPLVLFDRAIRGLDVDTVLVDNAAGATTAIRHMLAYGHREIGVVTDAPEIWSTGERLRGYRRALREAGIPERPDLISVGASDQAGGYQAARRLLGREDRPRALFTINNLMTAGAVRAARDLGLSIPGDLALIAFDDLDWATLVDPPITVVAQPIIELGRTVGDRILARLRGDTAKPKRIRLATELIVRASCGEQIRASHQTTS
jgi:LacI family transcriptional regulator